MTTLPKLAMLHPVMETAVQPVPVPAKAVRHGVVSETKPEGDKTACRFKDGSSILVSTFLASHVGPGDEIEFPLTLDFAGAGTELYIHKTSPAARRQDVYQASIGYAAQPKPDKRDRLYVRAEVLRGQLGISSVHLPCEVLRDYFYVSNRHQPWERQTTLYGTLRIAPVASLAELRLAFRLRQLELQAAGVPKAEQATLERAFNLLAWPELRACYDALLSDPSAPVLFPYGGFGSILVAGDRSRDGQTFFATRILSFLPERRHLALRAPLLRAPLRKFEFSSRPGELSRSPAQTRGSARPIGDGAGLGRDLEPVETFAGSQGRDPGRLRPERYVPSPPGQVAAHPMGNGLTEPDHSDASGGDHRAD